MNKEVRVNKAFSGYKPGETVLVAVDTDGVPLIREWRNRFNDAKIDNCVELVVQKRAKKTPSKSEASK